MKRVQTKKALKVMGVLGGMGPVASADFYRSVIEIAQRDYHAEQDIDFPAIIIYSMPVADFDETGFIDFKSVRKQLITGVRKLEKAGSDFIVIPCNTVHLFYHDMQASVHIPIISILDVTTKSIQQHGYKKAGLLNSESARQCRLYEPAFADQGIVAVSTTETEQKDVNRAILHVMSGTQGKEDIARLQAIINRFAGEGAQVVVLGCTELPLAISSGDIDLPLFSSSALLAEAAVRYAYSK